MVQQDNEATTRVKYNRQENSKNQLLQYYF